MYKLMRLPEVRKVTGLSRTAIYEGVCSGTFPAPIKIGLRSVAWVSDEVGNWIEARMNARGGRKLA